MQWVGLLLISHYTIWPKRSFGTTQSGLQNPYLVNVEKKMKKKKFNKLCQSPLYLQLMKVSNYVNNFKIIKH